VADTASDTKCDLATPFNRGCDLPKGHAGGCEGPRKATEATCPHCKRENSLIELNGRQQCKNCPYDSRTKATFDDKALLRDLKTASINSDYDKWIQSVCRDAADEIERLTMALHEANLLAIGLKNTNALEQREIERLTGIICGEFCGSKHHEVCPRSKQNV